MISIDKAKGYCEYCQKKASISINGIRVCSKCGDTRLIQIIGKCSKAVKHAIVTIKIMPRKVYEKHQKSI
jgi:hypothetical protein